jgi:glycosyltransferase involved in cell wall biosynthesis
VSDRALEAEWEQAIIATQMINELPQEERGHRVARLVIAAEESTRPVRADMLPSSEFQCLRGRRVDHLALLADCDVLLCLHDEPSAEARFEVAAALGFGVPVITVASGRFSEAIAHESGEAGLCCPCAPGASGMARPLSVAMLRYLKEPELVTAHRVQARRIFGDRFHAAKAAEVCSRSYVEACRSMRPDGGSTLELQDEKSAWASRQSA